MKEERKKHLEGFKTEEGQKNSEKLETKESPKRKKG